MSAYRRFRSFLYAEFKRKIYRQIDALCADLDELKQAVDEKNRATIIRQIHQGICALKLATDTAEAHGVRVAGQPGIRKLGGSRERPASLLRPFAIERLT